jgi:polyprenyl P-hydroxybenzoate/phenylacrylic acid decarboxylase-like protein
MRRFIVAITGASGAIYGIRLLQTLQEKEDIETHLIIGEWAARTIEGETDYSADQVEAIAGYSYSNMNLAAPLSSGSFLTDGMIVVPASMKTVAGIAAGYGDTLILRSAEVMVKERRTLILVPRETPLSPIALENLLKLSKIGVVILPPVPGFYTHPTTISELVDFTIGKILDQLSVEHDLFPRWTGE